MKTIPYPEYRTCERCGWEFVSPSHHVVRYCEECNPRSATVGDDSHWLACDIGEPPGKVVMRHALDSDTYAESGIFPDTESAKDDEMTEALCRERYPLLSERFLDGYTVAQVARGHRVSVAVIVVRIAAEYVRAAEDPALRSGLGRALVTGGKR